MRPEDKVRQPRSESRVDRLLQTGVVERVANRLRADHSHRLRLAARAQHGGGFVGRNDFKRHDEPHGC